MARIRSIKPEFWHDEKLAPLPPITRLVYLGLISQADDAGRLVDNVRLIDGLLFPETEESSRESLETLARLGRILRYTSASGQRLIQVVGWDKHQKVQKPSAYVLPAPTDADCSGDSPEGVRSVSGDFPSPIPYPPSPLPTPHSPAAEPAAPAAGKREGSKRKWRRVPTDWQPRPEDDLGLLAPAVLKLEEQKLRDHEFATARSDPDAVWRNWQRTAAERGGAGGRTGHHDPPQLNGAGNRLPTAAEIRERSGSTSVGEVLDQVVPRRRHG